MAAASMGVVREVLGADVVEEMDQPIIDYIANVLADEDFDFWAPEGHGIFEALGELLIDSGCVSDQEHYLQGLSFTPEMQRKRTKQFSGGWRMRIALARCSVH